MAGRLKTLAGVRRSALQVIRVFRSGLDGRRGHLVAGSLTLPCALGRAGIVHRKREGDGGTPAGRHRVLGGYLRADRVAGGPGLRRLRPIRADDGWCDAPGSARYNRPVRLPAGVSHERLWREDGLYDIVLDLAWNRGPIVRGRGSVIFLHCARPGLGPTEGCVALDKAALRRLLPRLGRHAVVEVVS